MFNARRHVRSTFMDAFLIYLFFLNPARRSSSWEKTSISKHSTVNAPLCALASYYLTVFVCCRADSTVQKVFFFFFSQKYPPAALNKAHENTNRLTTVPQRIATNTTTMKGSVLNLFKLVSVKHFYGWTQNYRIQPLRGYSSGINKE